MVPIIILVVYRLLFPNLQHIKVETKSEPHVEDNENLTQDTLKNESIPAPIEPIPEKTPPEKSSTEIALQLMDADERRIIQTLLEAKGSMLQKEISWKTGFSRVKTHRVLTRLIRRSVVTAEKYYNTNKIVLSDFLLDKKKEEA